MNNLVPTPLEYLQLEYLNGELGSNRAPSFITKQIAASNDLEAIRSWLAEYNHSPQTHRAYRKESERLLLWALIQKQKPLSSLTRDDLRDYQNFLASPAPKELWCGQRRARKDPRWRPFEGSLNDESIAHAITVINAMFSYLVEAGYLCGNPLGLMRRKMNRHDDKRKITMRFLEQALWQFVVDFIEALPKTTPRELKEYERIRFLFRLLYLQAPRISEIANAKMQDIVQIRGKWWWQITGKGKKTALIPVNDAMIDALTRYRQFYQLPLLPDADDPHYLFMNLNGTQGVTSSTIYRMVKKIFLDCAVAIAPVRPDFANKLKQASTHWMRHTAISHQADAGIELRYIKRSARHENVETTMHYQHAEEEKWHNAMAAHRMPVK